MSGEDLSGDGFAGFVGKLSTTGDFVGRGLPDAFRLRWDAWMARHLAPLPEPWPEGGLRLRLRSGARTASGLARPGRDSVGRRYPVCALVVQPFAPDPERIDGWCDAALPLLGAADAGQLDADGLWLALEALPRPGPSAETSQAPLVLWTTDSPPETVDPTDPDAALRRLFSSPRSSSP